VAQIRPLWRLMSAPLLVHATQEEEEEGVRLPQLNLHLSVALPSVMMQQCLVSVLSWGVPYARACLRDLWCLVHLFVLASLQLPLSFTTHQLHAVVAQQSVFH